MNSTDHCGERVGVTTTTLLDEGRSWHGIAGRGREREPMPENTDAPKLTSAASHCSDPLELSLITT